MKGKIVDIYTHEKIIFVSDKVFPKSYIHHNGKEGVSYPSKNHMKRWVKLKDLERWLKMKKKQGWRIEE